MRSSTLYTGVRGLHIHSPRSHWLSQNSFQSCELHSWSVPSTGVPFFTFYTVVSLCHFCVYIWLDRQLLTMVLELPTVFSTDRAVQGCSLGAMARPYSPGVEQVCHLRVCTCALHCSHNDKMPNNAFPECVPVGTWRRSVCDWSGSGWALLSVWWEISPCGYFSYGKWKLWKNLGENVFKCFICIWVVITCSYSDIQPL